MVIAAFVIVGLITGLATPVRGDTKWGAFRGQVVNSETSEPIAGAVVVAVWWETRIGLAHSTEAFYDARETVSDASGRFEIPRLWAPPWKWLVRPAQISVFAPGYGDFRPVVSPPSGHPFVDSTIVQMRPLTTREERIEYLKRMSFAGVPNEKILQLRGAVSKERQTLGFSP